MKVCSFLCYVSLTCAAAAQDVTIIGEIHDNPDHHRVQAELVSEIDPAAIVFEMLTEEQAKQVTPALREDEAALETALGWSQTGWPDFGMYYPIFAAADDARIYGAAVPREAAAAALSGGIAAAFGEGAARYGLDGPFPEDQQAAREALQMAAHCDALPEEMLPGMVDIQRLRDAVLARAILEAHEETGGPVVVITGNGHARRDWGIPAVLALVAPDLALRVIGQTEDGAPLEGGFDEILSAPTVERDDPCAAFQ